MKPGHENCPHDTETIQADDVGGCRTITLRTDVTCYHHHTDPVQRSDTGEIIGYYCHCCGRRRTTR